LRMWCPSVVGLMLQSAQTGWRRLNHSMNARQAPSYPRSVVFARSCPYPCCSHLPDSTNAAQPGYVHGRLGAANYFPPRTLNHSARRFKEKLDPGAGAMDTPTASTSASEILAMPKVRPMRDLTASTSASRARSTSRPLMPSKSGVPLRESDCLRLLHRTHGS